MPFVHIPKETSSTSIAGPSVTDSFGSRRRSGGGGLAGAVAFGSAGGGGGVPSSQERGAPERFEVDAMGLIQGAAMAPGHVLERPFALLNQAGRFITGTPQGEKGPLDSILAGIGEIGFGDADISHLLGLTGDVLNATSNVPGALLNSHDAAILAKVGDMPDSTVLDASVLGPLAMGGVFNIGAGGPRVDGAPILGMFGIGGRNMTLGEFKENLAKRGFNLEVNEDEGTVTELPWDEVVGKARSNALAFGSSQINDSALVDIAARIGLDPTNVLLGAGVLGKAGKLAAWATQPALRVTGRLAGRAAGAWGVGYLRDMARAGIRSLRMPSPDVSARAIAAGQMEGATLRGLGMVLATPRALLLPGTGSLARRYARGALRLELGTLALEYGSGAVNDAARRGLGEDNIVSGFMEPIHDFSQALLADKPMSQDINFMLVSAFALPAVPLLKEDIGAVRGRARSAFGDQDLVLWSNKYGNDGGIRVAADPLGFRRGKAKQSEFLGRIGGRDGFARLIDHIDMRIAFERLSSYKPFMRHYASFDEAMARSRAVGHTVAREAQRLRETRQINPRARMEMFERWARSHSRTITTKDGTILREVPQRIDFELSNDELIAQWNRYREIHDALRQRFDPVAEAIVGRANRLTREDLEFIHTTIQQATKGGKVDAQFVRDLLNQTPAMFEDATLSADAREFWVKTMNLGVSGPNGQYGRGLLDAAELDTQLGNLIRQAPPARELFHEAARAEAAAPASPPRATGGVLRNGNLRTIYSLRKLRELRTESNSQIRALTKEIDRDRAAFERKWTKRGNLRASARRTIVPSKPEVSPMGGIDELRSVAQNYNREHELPALKEREYWPGDPDFGRRTGEAYEAMPKVDDSPATREAYEAFVAETLDQWRDLEAAGYRMEPWTEAAAKAKGGVEQPYETSAEMQADVRDNHHLYFFTGGEPHPFMSTPLPEFGGLTANDIFRAVHDIMTHAQEGFQFGARGELNAAIKHSQMYSPTARRAMLTETHGQNSWTNFGPHRPQDLTPQERPYADQKAALLPDEIISEFEDRFVYRKRGARPAEATPDTAGRDLAMEHRLEQESIRIKTEKVRELRRDVREINKRADEIRTVRIDPSFLDENGNPSVDPATVEAIREQTAFVQDNFPRNYGIEKAPSVSWARYEPEDSHLAALLTERSNLAQVLFDYGPLGKLTQAISWLTSPIKASKMAHDGRQQVYNLLLPLKAKTNEVTEFLNSLRDEQNKGYSTGKQEQPLFRGITALPPNRIAQIARDTFGTNEKFLEAFTKKYGGIDRMHVMLDEAHNSLIRKVDQQVMRGQRVGVLNRLFRSGYWAWQNLPGLRTASDVTRMASKVYYPLLRFQADLRWQALNVIEADTIAFFRDGLEGTRFSRSRDQMVRRGGRDVNLTENAVAYHADQSGMPTGSRASDAAYEDSGTFLTNRNLAPVLKRSFQKQSLENVDRVLNDLGENDPVLQLLQRKYGPEKGTWAEQLNETLYSFDRFGVRRSIDEAVRRVAKYEKWSQAEYDQMVPFVNKLVERNQQTFNDLVQIHIGNIDRSRLERTLNSFWLYWPISYQIKATKWMVGVLTQRAFGQNTNLGGAVALSRAADIVREEARVNPDFARQFEDNEDLFFMASMLLPIAPWDVGVSLNRAVRYVGGNVLDLWPEYQGLENPGDFASKFLELGPVYSAELLSRLIDGEDR